MSRPPRTPSGRYPAQGVPGFSSLLETVLGKRLPPQERPPEPPPRR